MAAVVAVAVAAKTPVLRLSTRSKSGAHPHRIANLPALVLLRVNTVIRV